MPDGLWELFRRVVPPTPVRPQGGDRRRRSDREVLAAIVFVAMSGCTWQQLPPGFGPWGVTAFRRFTEWSRARVWAKLHRLVLARRHGYGAARVGHVGGCPSFPAPASPAPVQSGRLLRGVRGSPHRPGVHHDRGGALVPMAYLPGKAAQRLVDGFSEPSWLCMDSADNDLGKAFSE